MDYEPFKVSYTAGQPYVGATLAMYPPKGESNMALFFLTVLPPLKKVTPMESD
jgi:hypothetical protein